MSDREALLFLRDILDSISAIESFLDGIDREEFAADRKTFSATIRELEIIGEASGKIPDDIKSKNPDIPWRMLKDFRNVLAHHYFGINVDIVWDIVQRKLPDLKRQVEYIAGKES
jgi:uncharacterized protein with HEPN domain